VIRPASPAALVLGSSAPWAPQGSVVHVVATPDGTACLVTHADADALYLAATRAGDPGARPYLGFGERSDLVARIGRDPAMVEVAADRLAALEATVANQATEITALRAAAAAVVASKRPE
jgi:hypothetical protein